MSKLTVNEISPLTAPGIGVGAPNVQPGCLFNMQSTQQGIAIPRMTTVQRDAIPSPFDGLMIYNTDSSSIEKHDGATWVSAEGIKTINGLSAAAQTLTTGASGTAPAFQSAINTHTLNIPQASSSGVTSGLISKADYDSFNGRTYPTKNVVYVNKNPIPGPQGFNSIKDAVDSITDASATNPYIVQVGPGVYVEDTITMKDYVWVEGSEQDQTVIEVNGPGKHVIVGADNSGISKCRLHGAVTNTFAAVFYQSLTGTTNTAFFVEDCRFGQNDNLVIADATFAASAVFVDNCKFGSIYQFNHGFLARVGGRVIVRNSTTTGLTAPMPDYVFKATGAGSQIVVNGAQVRSGSVTSGACIHLADGGTLRALSLNVRMFGKAIWVENSGAGSIIDAVGVLLEGNTMDIQIDHPDADGTFNGSADHTKIFIDPSSTFSPVFSCNHLPSDSTGFVTVGDILQGDRYDRLANLSLIARKATTLGVIEDVDDSYITEVSGLDIEVQPGVGFLNDPTDIYLKQIEWSLTPMTLLPDTVNYIYVDTNGNVLSSASRTSLETTIVLGRVVTNATGIRFIENSDLAMNHYGNKTEVFLRTVIGPIFNFGCIITESPLNDRKLDVTAGEYYYGVDSLSVSADTEISWESFYRNGSGGFTAISSEDTVSNSLYDDGSGTLASIPAGQYARHHLYVMGDSGNERWFLVYAQATYTTQAEAANAPLPIVPTFFNDALVRVAGVIVKQGQSTMVSPAIDLRPRLGFAAPSGTAVTNHGDLTGLSNNDHPQYLLRSGANAMTGNFDVGGQNIINVNLVDGVDVSAHQSRHLPNGADPLTTAAPVASLSATTTNSTGTANSLSRSDHGHEILTGTAVALLPDQSNSAGVSANLIRADHVHNVPTAAPTTSLSATTANAQGVAATFARSDHGHAILTGTAVSLSPDQANAAGVSANLIRADHVHNVPTAAPITSLSATTSNAQGAAATFARSDHGHAILTGTAVSLTPDQANSAGTSANLIRADHVHNVPTAAPITSLSATTSNALGAAATFARSDHGHAILTGAASTLLPDVANSTGTSANLARADHNHLVPTAAPIATGSSNLIGTANSFARSDHTHDTTVVRFHQVNTGTQAITALTTLTGTSVTPNVAGTYLVLFEGICGGSAANITTTFQMYLNGGAIANTLRTGPQSDGDFAFGISINHVQAFNGTTDAIDVRVSASNTLTFNQRTITLVRIGP